MDKIKIIVPKEKSQLLREGKVEEWNNYASEVRDVNPNSILVIEDLKLDDIDFMKGSNGESLNLKDVELINCSIKNCIISTELSGVIVASGDNGAISIKNNVFICSSVDVEIIQGASPDEKIRISTNEFINTGTIKFKSENPEIVDKFNKDISTSYLDLEGFSHQCGEELERKDWKIINEEKYGIVPIRGLTANYGVGNVGIGEDNWHVQCTLPYPHSNILNRFMLGSTLNLNSFNNFDYTGANIHPNFGDTGTISLSPLILTGFLGVNKEEKKYALSLSAGPTINFSDYGFSDNRRPELRIGNLESDIGLESQVKTRIGKLSVDGRFNFPLASIDDSPERLGNTTWNINVSYPTPLFGLSSKEGLRKHFGTIDLGFYIQGASGNGEIEYSDYHLGTRLQGEAKPEHKISGGITLAIPLHNMENGPRPSNKTRF